MEEDELDPAFLDMPSYEGGNGLGELGRGFGNELGAGFGSSLHDDSDDPFSLSSSSNQPSRSRHTSSESWHGEAGGGSLADALGRHDDDDPLSTPLHCSRGAGTGAPASNRMSLAFELAAVTPGKASSRDLMRELGIEEGEDDEEEGEVEGRDGEGEELGYGVEEDTFATPRAVEIVEPQDDFSPSSTPLRRPHGRASSASLASFYNDSSHPSFLESPPSPPREELDAAQLRSFENSLETTARFLVHLRQHTSTEIDPHASPDPPPSTTGLFTSIEPKPIDYTDRQPLVEKAATAVIKSMYESVKQREGQVRELVELERLVSKNEVGWQAALASLEELPRDEEEGENAEHVVENGVSHDEDEGEEVPLSPSAEEDDPFGQPATNHHARDLSFLEPPPILRTSSSNSPSLARSELTHLRTITTSLISALSAINEVTQVHRASTGEAGRKLRALRGHLVTVENDLQGLARSEEYIRAYEAKELKLGGERRKGRYAEEAREVMRGVEVELEEGWSRAQVVLAAV